MGDFHGLTFPALYAFDVFNLDLQQGLRRAREEFFNRFRDDFHRHIRPRDILQETKGHISL